MSKYFYLLVCLFQTYGKSYRLINNLYLTIITYLEVNPTSEVIITNKQYHKYDRKGFGNFKSSRFKPTTSYKEKEEILCMS